MNFLKKIITLLAALAVFAATVYYESGIEVETVSAFDKDVSVNVLDNGATVVRDGNSTNVEGKIIFAPGDELQTSDSQLLIVNFDDNGEMRLDASSKLLFRGEYEDGYVFELKTGRVWINNQFTSSNMNLIAGAALLIPRRASVDVSFNSALTVVRSFTNHVNVELIEADYEVTGVAKNRNISFINGFLVAQGGQASIFLSKVTNNTETLRKLLYSKLIKEFSYGLMDLLALQTNEWVSTNLTGDKELKARVTQKKRDGITARNLKFSSLESVGYQVDRATNNIADLLTFSENKKIERKIDSIFNHLYDAEYLLTFGRTAEATERLFTFKSALSDELNSSDGEEKSIILNKLRRQYSDLHFVLPNDALFEAKSTLSELMIANLGGLEDDILEKMDLIRDHMRYSYTLVDVSELLSLVSLENYYSGLTELIEKEQTKITDMSFILVEENQIMDNLLKQYSLFYRDGVFGMKSYLEKEWLKKIPEGNTKNEERQTIISTKIDFLKQLQTFFLAEEVTLTDARAIALRLINEIKDLQPESDVAVSELFALRLADYGNFLQFLRATSATALRGADPETEYNKYLTTLSERVSIDKAIEEFLSGESAQQITVTQVIDKIKADMSAVGVTELELEEVSGVEQAIVGIKAAQIENIVFSGQYDWNRKLISNVIVDGKVLTETSVLISNLPLLLKPKEEVVNVVVDPVKVAEESRIEQVAKILLVQKMQQNGITVLQENIEILDIDAGNYAVNGARLVTDSNIEIAFMFNNKEDLASAMVVRTAAGVKKVDGVNSLIQISGLATDTYNKALDVDLESETQ